MRCRASALAVLFGLGGTAVLFAAEIRYDDVIYLADWKEPALHLKVLSRTPITVARDANSVIAYLPRGEAVEMIGLGETRHYVAARIATGAARGWVDAQALEPPPPALLEKLHLRREQVHVHREMIDRHEVAVTMTRAEVQSSLGKPDRKSRLRTKEGDEEKWFYVIYRYQPYNRQSSDSNGQLQQVVSYRREPAGNKVITFRNEEVVQIAEEQDEKARPPAIRVVPPSRPAD